MQPPDWSLPFEIMCDACDYAIRAVLAKRRDKKLYVVYCPSMTLNDTLINCTITEKELLVVVSALDIFRLYILGSHVVFT